MILAGDALPQIPQEISVGSFNQSKSFGYYENVLTFNVSEVGYRLNRSRIGLITPLLEWEIKREEIAAALQSREQ